MFSGQLTTPYRFSYHTGWGTFPKMHHPSSRSAQRQTRHFLPRYATTQIVCCLTFCLRRKSRCTPCDLECMTEFSRRQTTGCVELFSLACYILITPVYERILPCMYCITMYVTQNAVLQL